MSESSNLGSEVTENVKSTSGWGIVLGIVTALLGVLLLAYPLFAFHGMASQSPSNELPVGDGVTGSKHLRTYHPSVVVTPSPYDGIESIDNRFLWGGSHFPQFQPDFPCMAFDSFLTRTYPCLVS